VLILIFHIFFWGFLYSKNPENAVWTVFGTLALLLNMVTVPSLFFLEKGNSLNFGLIRQLGRRKFFISKFILILLIDLFWIILFTIIYGLRFLDGQYFILLFPRLMLMSLMMIISISILSLLYSCRIWVIWILLVLVVFGSILNKTALFPIHSFGELYAIFTFLLPPLLEIIYTAVTLELTTWRIIFLVVATIQAIFYFTLNLKFILRKDFT
jgi:hypothetical protein